MTSTRPSRRAKAAVVDDDGDYAEESSSKRASTRKRKRARNDGSDSDHEFEQILKEHERQQEEEEREKEERRQSRRAAATAKKQAEELDEIDHHDQCTTCQQGGELLLCDTCPRAYHLVCLELDEVPEGDWICAHCEENGVPEKKGSEEQKRGNMEYCRTCSEVGSLLCCDTCDSSFHAYCLDPPLTELPPSDENWSCPRCSASEPKNKPEKYVTWRWKYFEYPDPVAEEDLLKEGESMNNIDSERNVRLMLRPPRKLEPRRERELFVKWKYMSYWHCEWVPEYVLEIYYTQSLRMYWRKTDPEHPPEIEDLPSKHKENDPLGLEHRFYRFGVKPEWLQVHRILNHSQYTKKQYDYLVKWRDLVYEQATWESDDMDIPGLQEAIHKYWIHRENMIEEPIPKSIEKRLNAWRERQGIGTLDEERASRKENVKKHKYDAKKKYEEQPDFITATGGKLHEYQLEGINWLRHSWSQGIDVILADEMGLGKTIQSLMFLYSLVKEGHSKGPFLVAAPLSTLINWEREAEFWAPDFYVVTYIGDKESRTVIREHEFSYVEGAVKGGPKATRVKTDQGIKFHVLLTSYELINMDKATLSSIKWDALVVDEAHRLKNNQSLFFRNLSDYKLKYRLLLTGTPLQNNLEELFHLLNFLSPDRFYNLEEFTREFAEISKEDQIQKLHSMLGPHMLRRLKADVLTGMPSKSELIVRVELSPLQKKYYKAVLTRNFEALSVKSGGSQVSLLNILMELKKTCNHPYLFTKASLEAPKLKNGMYEGTALVKAAGKFVLLQKMLRKLKDQGHRVLIFSQMTRMLDILEDLCENEGYLYERIDGSITGQLRQHAIDRFNASEAKQFVFLLSTRAGGLGINLATADTVIIYDSDWNPHADIQAFSRAHRIGQKNKVMIYRFVTRNSVEERITTVAKKKMLLTHLVVRAGLGQKGPSLSKTELDDVLRWGTEELFKEDETGGDEKKSNEHAIIWDDDAVNALLDRGVNEETNKAAEGVGEKKDWTNEYLSSFKVAQYVTREAEQEDEEEKEDEREVIKSDIQSVDPEYWEKLLRHHYEQDQEVEAQQFGKGKRIRKQINYAAEHMQAEKSSRRDNDEDYEASDIETDTSEDGSGEDESGERGLSRKAKHERQSGESLPPLLSRVNGQIEVLGFNPRQRKAFYQAVMRYGMPTPDSYRSQWLTRDLKMKSEKAFKAYASLFKRHLCEPGVDRDDQFNDGVPREGLNRHNVLTRIGTMALIRRKIQEFERENGVWSMPEVREKQLSEQLITLGLIDQDNAIKKSSKEGSIAKDDVKNSPRPNEEYKEGSVTKEGASATEKDVLADLTPTNSDEVMEVDLKPSTAELEITIVEPSKDGEAKMDVDQDSATKTRRSIPPFKFNICDGGFTELHSIWKSEEAVVHEKGMEYEIWNRRHDYWLLCGFAVHGYLRYNELSKDPRFALINEPFKAEEQKSNFQEIKNRFLQRRYKLLEQALVIEEQLRRAANLQYRQKSTEQEATDNDEKTTNGTSENGTNTTKANEFNLQVQQTQKWYAQIEALVDANQSLAREALGGNKQALLMMQKVLTQLEEILNDMKSDVSRLPATVAQLPSLCQRLEMSERAILNRLTTRDKEAIAGQTPLPSPGPFVTSEMHMHFTGIQPKFAAIVNPRQEIYTPSHGAPIVVPLDPPKPPSETSKSSQEATKSQEAPKSQEPQSSLNVSKSESITVMSLDDSKSGDDASKSLDLSKQSPELSKPETLSATN